MYPPPPMPSQTLGRAPYRVPIPGDTEHGRTARLVRGAERAKWEALANNGGG